jgi:5'-phosphate synthase pdxT subunit
MKVGVLALQGDFALHGKALGRIGVEAAEVRKPSELPAVDGLIIPGGESTTLLKLMDSWGFVPALEKFHAEGKPVFGTCAGLIVLAREVENPRQFSLGLIDITTERNAYGRQKESFEAEGEVRLNGEPRPVRMVFIRAPRIRRLGPGVTPLASYDFMAHLGRRGPSPATPCGSHHRDECVMAREGSVLVASFHPELTDDPTVHRYFVGMVEASRRPVRRATPRPLSDRE